jgi:hypothetical protein
MIASTPPAAVAAAADSAPRTLEEAFASARAAARPATDPAVVLAGNGPVADKLAAIDALQSRLQTAPKARQVVMLNALAAAAAGTGQPPEVRAQALTVLGYAMPRVPDDAALTRALRVLLDAVKSPAYRLYALRGLGPACHGLPDADEGVYQGALLDLLDGPLAGEERETALIALYAFVSTREDLAKRDPALVAQLDARLLAPVEADPADFVRDPRGTPGSREMEIASLWSSARHRQALGDPAPAARVNALFDRLSAVETDPTVLSWIKTYRTAAPPEPSRPGPVKRSPSGPDEE